MSDGLKLWLPISALIALGLAVIMYINSNTAVDIAEDGVAQAEQRLYDTENELDDATARVGEQASQIDDIESDPNALAAQGLADVEMFVEAFLSRADSTTMDMHMRDMRNMLRPYMEVNNIGTHMFTGFKPLDGYQLYPSTARDGILHVLLVNPPSGVEEDDAAMGHYLIMYNALHKEVMGIERMEVRP